MSINSLHWGKHLLFSYLTWKCKVIWIFHLKTFKSKILIGFLLIFLVFITQPNYAIIYQYFRNPIRSFDYGNMGVAYAHQYATKKEHLSREEKFATLHKAIVLIEKALSTETTQA